MTLVTVTVLDVNDNDPVFENPHPDPIILMEVSIASIHQVMKVSYEKYYPVNLILVYIIAVILTTRRHLSLQLFTLSMQVMLMKVPMVMSHMKSHLQ